MKRRAVPGPPLSGLRWGDVWDEIARTIFHKPWRSLLTALGTVLGVGTVVCTIGLTQTAQAQVSSRFDALEATKVVVRDKGGSTGPAFPRDSVARLLGLPGVVAAGETWNLPVQLMASTLPTSEISNPPVAVSVVVVQPEVLASVDGEVGTGRWIDPFETEGDVPVLVVGKAAAEQLGLRRFEVDQALVLGQQRLTITGILTAAARRPELLNAVLVPPALGDRLLRETLPGSDEPLHELTVKVRPGAAQEIARVLPLVLGPQESERYDVEVPPSPSEFRNAVQGDLSGVFYLLGLVALTVGTLGIANSVLVAVMQRSREFGLRRALGARSQDLAKQVLAEAATLGVLGGLGGLTLGLVVIVGTALQRQWIPALNPAVMGLAPLVGLLVGLAAGAYPAWRASRIEPLEALRQ